MVAADVESSDDDSLSEDEESVEDGKEGNPMPYGVSLP